VIDLIDSLNEKSILPMHLQTMYRKQSSHNDTDNDLMCSLFTFLSSIQQVSAANQQLQYNIATEQLITGCCQLLGDRGAGATDVVQRVLLLLSKLLPHYPAAADAAVNIGIVPDLVRILQVYK